MTFVRDECLLTNYLSMPERIPPPSGGEQQDKSQGISKADRKKMAREAMGRKPAGETQPAKEQYDPREQRQELERTIREAKTPEEAREAFDLFGAEVGMGKEDFQRLVGGETSDAETGRGTPEDEERIVEGGRGDQPKEELTEKPKDAGPAPETSERAALREELLKAQTSIEAETLFRSLGEPAGMDRSEFIQIMRERNNERRRAVDDVFLAPVQQPGQIEEDKTAEEQKIETPSETPRKVKKDKGKEKKKKELVEGGDEHAWEQIPPPLPKESAYARASKEIIEKESKKLEEMERRFSELLRIKKANRLSSELDKAIIEGRLSEDDRDITEVARLTPREIRRGLQQLLDKIRGRRENISKIPTGERPKSALEEMIRTETDDTERSNLLALSQKIESREISLVADEIRQRGEQEITDPVLKDIIRELAARARARAAARGQMQKMAQTALRLTRPTPEKHRGIKQEQPPTPAEQGLSAFEQEVLRWIIELRELPDEEREKRLANINVDTKDAINRQLAEIKRREGIDQLREARKNVMAGIGILLGSETQKTDGEQGVGLKKDIESILRGGIVPLPNEIVERVKKILSHYVALHTYSKEIEEKSRKDI